MERIIPNTNEQFDVLGRFLYSKNNIVISEKRAHWSAFMPPKTNLQLSVFGISGVGVDDIKTIEEAIGRGKSKGRADVLRLEIEEEKLQLSIDNIPLSHANVIGWPNEKSERTLIAGILAGKARLSLSE